jgi:DNA-directed RNA polymerase subunit M/transcription elongation factor TFIIS
VCHICRSCRILLVYTSSLLPRERFSLSLFSVEPPRRAASAMAPKRHISECLGQAVSARLLDLSEQDFQKRLLCARGRHAGGNMHFKLLWTTFLRYRQLQTDFPADWRAWAVDEICREIMKYASEEEDFPEEKALWRIHARWKRRREVPPSQQSRAPERPAGGGAAADELTKQIDESCRRLLEQFPQVRDSLLQPYRRTLAQSVRDPRTGSRVSPEDFGALTGILEAEVRASLEEGPQLTEFCMEAWKVVCDRAMSKWRPYEQQTAAKLGLDELVSRTCGRPCRKPPLPEELLLEALDTPDAAWAQEIEADLLKRLRRAFQGAGKEESVSERMAHEALQAICAEATALQKYRDTLLSLEQEHGPLSPGRLLLLASAYSDCSSRQHELHGIPTAREYLELATGSPLVLVQKMVSFACSASNDAASAGLEDMLEWQRRERAEARRVSLPREAEELKELLRVGVACARCGSQETRHEIHKTRAADEAFDFRIFCLTCKATFSQN